MSENPGRLKLESAQPQVWTAVTPSPATQTTDSVETLCPEIENYLDHLSAGLLTLPYPDRDALRAEVRLHLQAAIAAREEMGMEQGEAVRETLTCFGEAKALAEQFTKTYQSTGANRTAFPQEAYKYALKLFGCAALLTPCCLSFLTVMANKAILPRTLVDLVAWSSVLFLIPALLGANIGKRRFVHPGMGTLLALSVLATITSPLILVGLKYEYIAPYVEAWMQHGLSAGIRAFLYEYLAPSFEVWTMLPFALYWWMVVAAVSASITNRLRSVRRRPRALAHG